MKIRREWDKTKARPEIVDSMPDELFNSEAWDFDGMDNDSARESHIKDGYDVIILDEDHPKYEETLAWFIAEKLSNG